MFIQIERWDGTYPSACRLFDIAEISNPLFPKADRAHLLTTQNHHHNPMRQINQQLGFEVLDVFVSFAKPVDAGHMGQPDNEQVRLY